MKQRRGYVKSIVALLIVYGLASTLAGAAPTSVNVSFTARSFRDEVQSLGPPANTVSGSFSFRFDDARSSGVFSFPPDSFDLTIAGTSFANKVLRVSLRWDGQDFEEIEFWGDPYACCFGDDFVLTLFPNGGGQNKMRYSLLSALNRYASTSIIFTVEVMPLPKPTWLPTVIQHLILDAE